MTNVVLGRRLPVCSRLAWAVAVVVIGSGLHAQVALAQEAEKPVPIVRLASPQTPPGGETFVTVMLTNVPGQAVQVLKTEIEYQTNHLTYVAARPGFAADLAGATVDVKVEAMPPTSPSPGVPPRPRTRISLTATGKKAIPNGPVAELRFRVGPAFTATHEGAVVENPDAKREPAGKAGAVPTLPTPRPPAVPPSTAKEAGKETDAPVQRIVIIKLDHHSQGAAPLGADVPLLAEAGEVRVTTQRKGAVPIVFACFFYMH